MVPGWLAVKSCAALYGLGARRSARLGYGVTVIVASIEGWMVQVMA